VVLNWHFEGPLVGISTVVIGSAVCIRINNFYQMEKYKMNLQGTEAVEQKHWGQGTGGKGLHNLG